MTPDWLHLWVLNELVSVLPKLLSVIFKRLWKSKSIPNDWRKAKVALILKIVEKVNLRNYSMVSLTGVPGKISE